MGLSGRRHDIRRGPGPDAREAGPTTLFIGGLGRSGTTILELSMATDPGVVSLGEVTHLWRRSLLEDESCGCGRTFHQCPFWRSVGQAAFGGWENVDPHRVLELQHRLDRTVQTPRLALGLGSGKWRDEVREYASYYASIYRAAAKVSGAGVVIDSSKQASLPHLLRLDPAVDLRVLHCVRDSRAVAYSWTKRVRRPEAQGDRHEFMVRYTPTRTALKWLQHNVVVEALRPVGVPVLRLRYEDWVRAPHAQVLRALGFAGVPEPRPRTGDSWVSLGETHTCSGNPARFRRGTVPIRSDDGWRTGLPAPSRRAVTLTTLPMLALYRYLGPARR